MLILEVRLMVLVLTAELMVEASGGEAAAGGVDLGEDPSALQRSRVGYL